MTISLCPIHRLAPKRLFPIFLCLGLVLGAAGPIDFTPSAEAASPAAVKRLKKKLKKLKKRLRMALATSSGSTTVPAPAPAPAPPFIEMVTVGNPGNGTDAGNTSEASVYGAVAAAFQIGKYEVTNAQYAAFLNAVAAADPKFLFDQAMEDNARGGIRRFGASPNFGYAVKAGMGDKPVNFVDFWDCCRFCNWLHNGMPTGAQGATTTEFGAYDLSVQANLDNNTVTGLPGAKFFLPTEEQWYKAAYHDPRAAASGGPPGNDNYWLYPMQSDGPAIPALGTVNAIGEITNDTANIANYSSSAAWDSDDDGANETGNVTSVGSGGPGSASFYGACDLGGNVWEWNETVISTSFRGLRGGSWNFLENNLRSSLRNLGNPGTEADNLGFRVASP